MPGPFPGMDPYLEDPALWPEVHHRLITYVGDLLQPLLLPRYYSHIDERLYIEDPRHAVYPDLTVVARGAGTGGASAVSPLGDEPVMVAYETRHREAFIEIRAADSHEVVTVIEILSPANKAPFSRGHEQYRAKQDRVMQSQVSLVEIDLLREGAPTVMLPPGRLVVLGHFDYLVIANRTRREGLAEVYAFSVRDRLPRVRVPLRDPDPDVVLDLPAAFGRCYDSAGYRFRLDYTRDPAPPLRPQDQQWSDDLLRQAGLRGGGTLDGEG